jgi:hypothetical protein
MHTHVRNRFICITQGMGFFAALFGTVYRGDEIVDVESQSGFMHHVDDLGALPEAIFWADGEGIPLVLAGRRINVIDKTLDQVLDEATRPGVI